MDPATFFPVRLVGGGFFWGKLNGGGILFSSPWGGGVEILVYARHTTSAKECLSS